MQDKLQVLSDALPDASQAEGSSLIDGSNWEGDADSKAWQYDCEVLATHTCLHMFDAQKACCSAGLILNMPSLLVPCALTQGSK